jgi:phosphoglycerate kinase
MKNINSFDFNGKKAIVRVDFNVPLDDALNVSDATRIKAALPTINKILADGGSVILMSHLGRPKANENDFSLKHILSKLEKLLSKKVLFATDCIGKEAEEKAKSLMDGEVLLVENLRFHPEEKNGDHDFAKALASLGDVYVNDAFGTAHRAHASTAVIAKFFPEDKMFGLLMEKELAGIEKVLHNNQKPVSAIIGGAKVSSKIGIIENLLPSIDNLIIGGGMTFTFVKAIGGKIGNSLVEDDFLDLALQIMKKAEANGVNIILPRDSKIADAFSNDAKTQLCPTKEIPDGWMGLDIGPQAMAEIKEVLLKSKTILFNGPMGVFEMENFSQGTISLVESIAEATANGAFSLVGGGDSVAAVNLFAMSDKMSYISTGGGAMLESLEGKILPGIKAIQD